MAKKKVEFPEEPISLNEALELLANDKLPFHKLEWDGDQNVKAEFYNAEIPAVVAGLGTGKSDDSNRNSNLLKNIVMGISGLAMIAVVAAGAYAFTKLPIIIEAVEKYKDGETESLEDIKEDLKKQIQRDLLREQKEKFLNKSSSTKPIQGDPIRTIDLSTQLALKSRPRIDFPEIETEPKPTIDHQKRDPWEDDDLSSIGDRLAKGIVTATSETIVDLKERQTMVEAATEKGRLDGRKQVLDEIEQANQEALIPPRGYVRYGTPLQGWTPNRTDYGSYSNETRQTPNSSLPFNPKRPDPLVTTLLPTLTQIENAAIAQGIDLIPTDPPAQSPNRE